MDVALLGTAAVAVGKDLGREGVSSVDPQELLQTASLAKRRQPSFEKLAFLCTRSVEDATFWTLQIWPHGSMLLPHPRLDYCTTLSLQEAALKAVQSHSSLLLHRDKQLSLYQVTDTRATQPLLCQASALKALCRLELAKLQK